MRGLLCKFNIIKKIAESRTANLTAKWRILLYSLPVLALLKPETTHAAGVLKTLGKGAAGLAGNAFSSVIGASVEAASTLLVWLFIIVQLSDILADMFSGIFLFLINFLIGISQYNSFLGSSVVTIGWTVTRDLANMFLVVALLVIAFATILNINSYQASNLLKDFFFAAILVNFSKLICGVLIDASQVVMMTFVSGYSETAAGNFVKMFQVGDWLQLALATKDAQTDGTGPVFNTASADAATKVLAVSADAVGALAANFFSGIGANIFTAIIAFIGILAVISLDIILVVRIVTLWFLIVASPLAFVAKVLPVTKGFSSKWWHAFNQQLIAGPVVAFIVWISLASVAVSDDAFNLMNEAKQADKLFTETQSAAPAAIAGTKISQWENLALYFVPIVIFFLGAKWAVSVAGGAAKSISGFANKRLSGFARSGLSALRKQAVGKGQFSVVTAGKKGFVGERAPVTSFLGKVGSGVNQLSGGKFNKIEKGASWAFGGAARGRNQAGYKNMKNAVSHLGFGELGKKRTDAGQAEELGQHFDKIGKQYFDEYMATANNANLSPEARAEARSKAVSYKNTYEAKATEARKKANDYQKEIFTAEGKTDPQVLLNHLKERTASGNISTLELDTAKTMINDFYEKKQKKEIAEKKAQMGTAWDPKFEREIEGKIASEQEGMKSELDRVVSNYKAVNVPADLQRDTDVKKAKKDFDDDINNARPDTQLKVAAATLNSNVQVAQGQQQAVANAEGGFAAAVADQLKTMQDKHEAVTGNNDPRAATLKDQAINHLMNATNNIPLQRQTAFLQGVVNNNQTSDITLTAAAELAAKIQTITQNPDSALQEIQARQSARGGGTGEQLFKPTDLKLKKGRGSSTYDDWDGDAGIKFAAALSGNQDQAFSKVLSNLDRESFVSPVQKIIGQKFGTMHAANQQSALDKLENAFVQIRDSADKKRDPGGLKSRGRADMIAQAIEEQHPHLAAQVRMLRDGVFNAPPAPPAPGVGPGPAPQPPNPPRPRRGPNRPPGGGNNP